MTRLFSPYELNPLNINPLRDLVASTVDFDRVNSCAIPKIFVTATNVRTGQARVFTQPHLSVETIMASACLPSVYQAVEIDGEAYWDGGYMGNPPLYPLFYDTRSSDVIIVHINPMRREEVPRTSTEIQNRINEISFNSSLLRELRAIQFVKRLSSEGRLTGRNMKEPLLHMIFDDELMTSLGSRSKVMPAPGLVAQMFDAGRSAAQGFVDAHLDQIGARDTVDQPPLYG